MRSCPLCGGPIFHDVKLSEKISSEDPAIAGSLEEFFQMMKMGPIRQEKFFKDIEGLSSFSITEAIRIWKERKFYQSKPEQYFVGIARRVHEEQQRSEATSEGFPLAYESED